MKKMYHYKECGLDNVWLVNGYHVRHTAYGDALSIEDVAGLYDSIARTLVEKVGTLGGKEIRFLRKHLGQSQRALGDILGSDEQTISRWERGETTIPASADRLLRAYYRELKQGDAGLKELLDRLAERTVRKPAQPVRLKRATERESGEKEWKLAA